MILFIILMVESG